MSRVVVPAVDPEWNERQRRVLDLLAKGATNPEIAAALGITLDGAKWHVSDIISRLGVDAREEAALYWRARNGAGARLRRFARGALPASAVGRWLAGGGSAAVIAVGVAVLVVVLVSQGGGDDTPAPGSPTETPTPAATAVPTPQAGISAPTQLSAPRPLTPNGRQLRFADPIDLPPDLVSYHAVGCYFCGRPDVPNLYRRTRNAAGEVLEVSLFASLDPSNGYPHSFAADWERQELSVAWCEGYCGGEGDPTPDSELKLHRSRDGGVTWTELGGLPLNSILLGTLDGDVLTGHFEDGRWRYSWFGSGNEPVAPTAGMFPSVVRGAGLVWIANGATTYVDSEGKVVFELPDGPKYWPGGLLGREGANVTYAWYNPDNLAQEIIRVDGSGEIVREVYHPWDGDGARPFIIPRGMLGLRLVYGAANLPAPTSGTPRSESLPWLIEPAIIDLESATVTGVRGFPEPVATGSGFTGGFSFFVHLAIGPFLRISGAGDCLNVREGPATSAAVLGCYRDNVVLRLRDNVPVEAGGISWLPVATPDGRPGWASAQYLER